MISVVLYVKISEAIGGVKIRQRSLANGIECLIFAPVFLYWAASLCHSLVRYTVEELLLRWIN